MSIQHSLIDSRVGSPAIRLPTELLVIIFHFVGPSTPTNPYPYLPLSWVCRRWRSVVRNDSRFWTVTYTTRRLYKSPLLATNDSEEDIRHSESYSRAIDLIIHRLDANEGRSEEPSSWITIPELEQALSSKSFREKIRTLLFPEDVVFRIEIQPDFCFPRLERLTLAFFSHRHLQFRLAALITTSTSLRYMTLSCFALLDLHNKNLSHHLFRIEGLKLMSIAVCSTVRHILENMRNLQVLIIDVGGPPVMMQNEPTSEVMDLPKLRILSLESAIGEIWEFKAPKLDHLSILHLGVTGNMPIRSFRNWNLLDSFDFSQISNVLIGLHTHMSPKSKFAYLDLRECVGCISASDHLLLDCSSFRHFQEGGFDSQPLLDDYSDLPPKNCFHIPFAWKTHPICFHAILGRATNLVELTLHYGGISLKKNPDFYSFMEGILDFGEGIGITSLNIVQGRSFTAVCALLGGRRVPDLERLMYHNTFTVRDTTSIPHRLKTLQSKRLDADSRPLKILELRNFSNVSPERVQEIEDLGVQLVQMPR